MTEQGNTYRTYLDFIKKEAFNLQKCFTYEEREKIPFEIFFTPNGIELTDIPEDKDMSGSKQKEASLRAMAAILNLDKLQKTIDERDKKKVITEDLLTLALYGSVQLIQAIKLLVGVHDKDLLEKFSDLLQEPLQPAFNVLTGGERARDNRYKENRELYSHALSLAKDKWQGGSKKLHYQMKDWLLNEYADENGNVPFLNLSEKTLNKKLKELLRDIGKPELIHGLSSSPPPKPRC